TGRIQLVRKTPTRTRGADPSRKRPRPGRRLGLRRRTLRPRVHPHRKVAPVPSRRRCPARPPSPRSFRSGPPCMSWRGRHSRHPLDPRPRRLRQTLTTTFLSERMTLDLQSRIEALINRPAAEIKENDGTIAEFLEALNSGTIRAASPTADNQWVTN